MYLLQKVREFLKLDVYRSNLERGISMDKSNENEIIEEKIDEYCRVHKVSREKALEELSKLIKDTAQRAGYRLRVNNGGFIHNG